MFKSPGAYIGLFVGLILSLQIKNNRMFLLEGQRDLECNYNPTNFLSCADLSLIIIILCLLAGFIIGGIVYRK